MRLSGSNFDGIHPPRESISPPHRPQLNRSLCSKYRTRLSDLCLFKAEDSLDIHAKTMRYHHALTRYEMKCERWMVAQICVQFRFRKKSDIDRSS